MFWKNDGENAKAPIFPDGVTLERFPERKTALDDWLDIIQYGLTDGRLGAECYENCMTKQKNYDDNYCFFLVKDGVAAATITVICDDETNDGYIHMVACRPEYRGMGLGTLLNDIAVYTLKTKGMKTAYLTTDDFRIPAIKSYLRCGFYPDLSTDDFKERWENIFKEINK